MSSFAFLLTPLPVADWMEGAIRAMTRSGADFFSFLEVFGQSVMDAIAMLFQGVPPILFVVIVTGLAVMIQWEKKRFEFPVFVFLGLLFIYNQQLWDEFIYTLTLIVVASTVSIIIGVPMGIVMGKSERAQSVIKPILDFMQTMPAFVYLIPAVAFFGIGMVPGVFASVIFALPPTVRFTNLGLRQIPKEINEAADAFGSTTWQKLWKIEIPLAFPTIMAGMNQTIMLSLSMVVIASMIGAPGLGRIVLSALQRAQLGNGFVAGLAIVIMAIIIDRFAQKLNTQKHKMQ